jgi:hypothetical protein
VVKGGKGVSSICQNAICGFHECVDSDDRIDD